MKKISIVSRIRGLNTINRSLLPKQEVQELLKLWAPPKKEERKEVEKPKRYDWVQHNARLALKKGVEIIKKNEAKAASKMVTKREKKSRFQIRREVMAHKAMTRMERAKALFIQIQGLVESLNVGERISSTKEALKEYISLKKMAIVIKKRAARALLRAIKPIDENAEHVVVWAC
jgi:hypothetical protein